MQIKEIMLFTNKLNDLKKFYNETLEMDLLSANENSFTVGTSLSKITFQNANETENPFYHFAFNIPENKLSEAKEWLRGRTELLNLNGEDEFDFKTWNAHSVYFFDPAGNVVELIARHNLKNGSKEKFTGKSLLCISEAGIVTDDVGNFYAKLNASFNIPIFSGDLKIFTAAGDDNGLFIIVPKGRHWFPTGIEAEIFPVTIHIRTGIKKKMKFENLPYVIVSD